MLQDAGFNLYGYVPNMAANIIMLVVFALSTIVHFLQVVRYRQWWLLLLPVGTLAEVGGYIPRLKGHYHPTLRDPYVATMCLLIITPCLFAAVHFTVLGRMCTLFPRKYTLVRPVLVMPFFVTVDVASLVIQGVGAANAGTSDSAEAAESGSTIAAVGVGVQLAGYLLFFVLFSIFYYRIRRDPPPGLSQMHTLMIATMISSGWIILRSIYRLIEMGEGWDGVINNTEWCLFVFDAVLVFFAVTVYNIVHPGKYLPKKFSWNYNPDKDGIWWENKNENELESPPVAYPEKPLPVKEV
ncbi:unnamed protein product [Malassezia sympodialis ATCC 42132]|uniref:Similar to S.cerevisiae protein RTA1 (Protein involved in 7-aminocholesterol resistance) n=1 Tax=Malassezia sympodialis (strain ATCC 42132) TaxID=1230383 RepID=M5E525_MALS4|nr:uncharacterized protein MSY001_0532 [Malassezia sympodialis ATCC 42132]CCU97826.1 unnamed protein product [Malassezia sympodialis ATCC 42132]SHO77798.1 Similar to S.cerevisiae protein RTA1 (Protein involved in 7-aminocholesterol resistance) [Malassezia sympodialis ATCC 42132]|eukprot:XP_018739159.1 uncharacterized protein MSY001_0532 [Malassezia sympodialis ATCC 42132]